MDMKSSSLFKPVFTIIIVLLIVSGFVYLVNSKAKVAERVDQNKVEDTQNIPDVTLESNINTFMEAQVNPEDLGKDNYHCGNTLYGYDDKYAYASVLCLGFITNSNGELEQASGFGVPARFEYTQTNFKIVGFVQQGEDDESPSLSEIFPKEFYDKAIVGPSKSESDRIVQEVRNKAENNVPVMQNNVQTKTSNEQSISNSEQNLVTQKFVFTQDYKVEQPNYNGGDFPDGTKTLIFKKGDVVYGKYSLDGCQGAGCIPKTVVIITAKRFSNLAVDTTILVPYQN